MLVWIIAAGLGLLLLAFNLLYVRLQFACDLHYGEHQKSVEILFVPVFERFRWEKKIAAPTSPSEWIDLAQTMLSKKKAGSKNRSHAGIKPEQRKSHDKPLRFLNVPFADYYRIFRLFMSHLVLERLHWRTSLGLDDPMHTALVCGGVWTFKGNFLGFFSHFSSMEQVDLMVQPVYDTAGFSSQLDSIFKIRIVYIMLIIILASFISVRGYINGYSAREAQPSH